MALRRFLSLDGVYVCIQFTPRVGLPHRGQLCPGTLGIRTPVAEGGEMGTSQRGVDSSVVIGVATPPPPPKVRGMARFLAPTPIPFWISMEGTR